MKDKEEKQQQHPQEEYETMGQELRSMMQRRLVRFIHWMKPRPGEAWYFAALRYLYKIPAVVLLIVLSPVAIIVLLFTFIAAF